VAAPPLEGGGAAKGAIFLSDEPAASLALEGRDDGFRGLSVSAINDALFDASHDRPRKRGRGGAFSAPVQEQDDKRKKAETAKQERVA
jgi:hypothetical protein